MAAPVGLPKETITHFNKTGGGSAATADIAPIECSSPDQPAAPAAICFKFGQMLLLLQLPLCVSAKIEDLGLDKEFLTNETKIGFLALFLPLIAY